MDERDELIAELRGQVEQLQKQKEERVAQKNIEKV